MLAKSMNPISQIQTDAETRGGGDAETPRFTVSPFHRVASFTAHPSLG